MVAQPCGEADVPAIPELADITRQKRPIEVLGRMNAEQVAQPDREGAVAGKIEEQVTAVGIHVRYFPTDASCLLGGVQPILLDQVGQDEFVEQPGEDSLSAAVEIV